MVECKGPQHCPHITELPPQPLPWWHQVLWWLRDSAQHCLHHLQTPALSHRVSLGSWYSQLPMRLCRPDFTCDRDSHHVPFNQGH